MCHCLTNVIFVECTKSFKTRNFDAFLILIKCMYFDLHVIQSKFDYIYVLNATIYFVGILFKINGRGNAENYLSFLLFDHLLLKQ